MITLKEWMEIVDYKITEGDQYTWNCYGFNAYQLSSWNGVHDTGGWSFNIIFDTKDQTVYEVEVCDYTNDRAYRVINPDFKKAFEDEVATRGEDVHEAWDGVSYTDLEVDDDWFQKSLAIKENKVYDTRISIPLEMPDSELLRIMLAAHERDMTFNEFAEEALRQAIEAAERDPEGLKQRFEKFKKEANL